jgi:predicted O-methyltransferase YrrM
MTAFMTSFDETWRAIQTIDGWLTEGQARMLYDSARAVSPGETIVEIGSHRGRSTVLLAEAKPGSVGLLAVDPYGDPRWGGGEDSLEIFRANLARHHVDDRVRLARQLGSEAGQAWTGAPVGLLFVDGAHDYTSVIADLAAWRRHLSPTATVLMHDVYSSPGVTRAAFRYMFGSRAFRYADSSRSLARFRRAGSASPTQAALSSVRMLRPLPWMVRNLLIKLAVRRGWKRVVRVLGRTDSACLY